MLEVEVDGDIEVIVNTNVEVIAGNMNIAIIEDTNDIEVTVNRQEYVITGDEIYIPKRFEDAPTWMQELITQVVDTSISAQIQDLNGISQSLESMIDAMEVAKNTYELSVISSNDIDERINTAVTTLNSAMNEADATVLEVAQTRVTPKEAAVITVDVITAELAKTEAGTLGATVSNLQTAVATEEEARSTSIEILTSSIEGAFDANATAMNYINTYVGLDEVGASTGTGLSGYLEGSTGIVGEADSKVVNNVYVDALGNAKSKFEYGSIVAVNGINHIAGFGLSNSAGTDIGSEFWINAAKFKFTNDNKTGSKAPFTIDASGAIPQISFNGIVNFSNITNTTGTGSNLLYNSAPKIGSETKGWYVWTNSGMAVNLSAGFDIWKPTGGASVAASIVGNPSIGSVYDVGQSLKFPVIAGSRYEASAYISAHRSNSFINLLFYDTSGTYIGESQGNVINYAGSNALVNWGRSSVFTTAPGNAATALLIIRSVVTGTDPYCFAANAFAGVAEINQTTPSVWSEGTSAGATYTSELSNDAGFTTHSTINNNNDAFAQKLGYLSYADMVAAATAGQTIINGGYLRGELIEANSINAGQIDAYAITGKQITGGRIVGAIIEGVVIKASYLDLDGELEVLTNYHLCMTQAQLNAVISAGGTGALYTNGTLMPDAVYIAISDEYRIPSISQIREITATGSGTISGNIYSYDTSNARSNYKAVRIRPYVRVESMFNLISISQSDNIARAGLHYKSSFTPFIFNVTFGNLTMLRVRCDRYGSRVSPTALPLTRFTVERYNTGTVNYDFGDDIVGANTVNVPVTLGFANAVLHLSCNVIESAWNQVTISAVLEVIPTVDFNPTSIDFIQGKLIAVTLEHAAGWQYDPGALWDIPYPSISTRIDSGIIINNML